MASVVQKYIKAYRLYGWRETLNKMYSVRALPPSLPPSRSLPPSTLSLSLAPLSSKRARMCSYDTSSWGK